MTKSKTSRIAALSRVLPAMLLGGIVVMNPDIAAASGFGTTGNNVLGESCGLITSIKTWLFSVVYVLGAIGLVLIAVSAFLGRFKFSHLIALGGGLFIVAAADLLIDFVTASSDTACTGVAP